MKKAILVMLLVASSLLAKEPLFYGTMKGDIRSYYPEVKVSNAYMVSNTLTTGITGNKAQSLYDATSNFVKDFKIQAKKSCKDSYAYALDNVETQYTTFGEYANTLIYVSLNIVCISSD